MSEYINKTIGLEVCMKKIIPILTEADQIGLTVGQMPTRLVGQEMIPVLQGLVKRVPSEHINNPYVLEGLQATRMTLDKEIRLSLGCEQGHRAALSKQRSLVIQHENRVRGALVTGLPYIDPSFLAWKNTEGFPLFAVYGINSPMATITVSRNVSRFAVSQIRDHILLVPELPQFMADYYIDPLMKRTLTAQLQGRWNASRVILSSKYEGSMPSSVRDKIRAYLSAECEVQFDYFFIIAEAPRWEVEKVILLPVGDPLVVGVKFNMMWVIDFYDLTSSEQVALELCRHSGEGIPHQGN